MPWIIANSAGLVQRKGRFHQKFALKHKERTGFAPNHLCQECYLFVDDYGNNVDYPADPKETACKDPKNPNNHLAPKNAVDPLNDWIKKDRENNVNSPAKFVDCRCHNKLPNKTNLTNYTAVLIKLPDDGCGRFPQAPLRSFFLILCPKL